MIDRIVVKEGIRSRLFDSFEAALRLADGYAVVDVIGQEEMLFSEHYSCPYCGFTVGELEPRLFSFNAPFGACPDCDGLGVKLEVDTDLVIPDTSKTLRERCDRSLESHQFTILSTNAGTSLLGIQY